MKKQLEITGSWLCAGLIAFAPAVTNASQQENLPTPPPSVCPDTQSSVNVPLADWPDLGRRVKVDLSAHATPSNLVQIAFGRDANGDEDLEPEETMLVIGVDCGESFVRDETGEEAGGVAGGESRWRWTVEADSSTSNSISYAFTFKQPAAVAERFTFAKVTTGGRGDSAAQIASKVWRSGLAVIVK